MSTAIANDSDKEEWSEATIDLPRFFLWNKIGTESGESLHTIIRRKEVEREACGGVFFWGVGNSVRTSLPTLRRLGQNCSAVFSEMRSKPKNIDVQPPSLLLWLGYEDDLGNRHPLPTYSFVTSRGGGVGQSTSRSHYALLCKSESSITDKPVGEIDATTLVNIRSGLPVGYSQVTSVVARNESTTSEPMLYPVTFTAELVGLGQVRLTDCVDISASDVSSIAESAVRADLSSWKRSVVDVKKKLIDMSGLPGRTAAYPAQMDMLDTA